MTVAPSDKPGVAQLREFAGKLYTKRRVHERTDELIGGLVLDAELAAEGLRDANDEERQGWGAVHWRAAGWSDIGLRGRINEALRMLDEAASEADAQYECTFGDSKRVRDKPNPQRVGKGFCPRTKFSAAHCTRLRLLIKLVWRSEWAVAAQLRDELIGDGARVPTIANDDDLRELSVINLRESLRVVRLEVHGRQRVNNMLKSSITTARAQEENKLRAAAKRDINAVMERSPRGAIESVTVGTGDGVDVLTDPVAVAVKCCEFSARRMGSMQPKSERSGFVSMASRRAAQSGLLRATGHGAGSSRRSTTTVTTRCSTMATSTRPAACAVKRCAWSGSLSGRPRLRTAGGNGGGARRAGLNGPKWPGTSRAWRRLPIYPTTLRCSSATAPKVAPAACGLCLARRWETTGRRSLPAFAALLEYLERPLSRLAGATVCEADYI